MRVALFVPCCMDAFEPEVGVALTVVLQPRPLAEPSPLH